MMGGSCVENVKRFGMAQGNLLLYRVFAPAIYLYPVCTGTPYLRCAARLRAPVSVYKYNIVE